MSPNDIVNYLKMSSVSLDRLVPPELTFLLPRRDAAIAELMGLPRAFLEFQQNTAAGRDIDDMQRQKAQIWGSLCAIDRLFGMVTNLPPGKIYFLTNQAPFRS